MSPERTVYGVDTRNLGRSREAPVPVKFFDACPGRLVRSPPATNQTYSAPFDTHDGKRFLVNCTVEPPGRFLVLLNWPFGEKL